MRSSSKELTYNDVARVIRNSLREYSAESVVALALRSLASFRRGGLEDLRNAPWLTALIVKLVLEDKMIPLRSRRECPPPLFDRLRQMLWEVSPIRDGDDAPAAHLALRVMLHTQLLFQLSESWSFLRWPALIWDLQDTHPTRAQFETVLGMEPRIFIGLCWGAYTAVLDGKQVIKKSYLHSLEPLYGAAVETFLRAFSRNLVGLRQELRQEFDARLTSARDRGEEYTRDLIEVAEFPWLQRYPLLLDESGDYIVWHPRIFARGMEQAVHQRLSNLGQQYTDPFSKVFETYVLRLLTEANVQYIDEATFKSVHGRDSSAVEAIVELGSGNVLIEAKMSLFPDDVVLSDSSDVVFRKIRRIREAIVQGWKVTGILERGRKPAEDAGCMRSNYLIVVTSRQLNICNGNQLQRMFGENVFRDINPEARFGAPTELQYSVLPPTNIFFISIEELEHLSGVLSENKVELWSLLERAAQSQSSPASSVFQFDQFLGEYTNKWKLPSVQVRAMDRVGAELINFFEPNNPQR